MTPYEKAKELYDGNEIFYYMDFCARNGVVFADNELFLCAYPTHHSLIETESKQANEIKSKKELDKVDTWHVCIASGDKNLLMDLVEPLEYVSYRRMDKKIRIIRWEKLYGRPN